LAIIDLSERAAQPMQVDSGRLSLAFNGEIYNFQELKRRLASQFRFESDSDSEVILRLYDASEGDPRAMLRQLRGMFAFALWDRHRRRLLLARDRFGIKPLFVHENDAGVFFASTLDAIAGFPEVPRRLDWTTLFDQASLMCPPGPYTCLEGVRQIEPGSALLVGDDGRSEIRYWQITVPEAKWLEPEAAAAGLEPKLDEAVRLHMVADVEVGAFLSGGVDSGLVTARASASAGRPLRTFSAVFPDDPVDEGPWAREAATRTGTIHTEVDVRGSLLDDLEEVVSAMDQPLGLESAIPLYRVSRAAARHLKVVLTGDGGDEVFAGYERHGQPLGRRSPKVRWIPAALRPAARWLGDRALPLAAPFLGRRAENGRYLLETLAWDEPAEHLSRLRVQPARNALGLLSPAAREAVDATRNERRVRELWERWPGADPLHRVLAVELHTRLVDEMLAKADRMTMAWGLEARVPLLDHELVEAAFSVAPPALRSGSVGKLPLRRLAGRSLGPESADRGKRGFGTSLARDLADGPTRRRLDALLEQALEPGLFDREAARRLCLRASSGDSRDVGALMALLTAGVWAGQRGYRR
jgi:asparagine synthase (glutamine-hydrolysing)